MSELPLTLVAFPGVPRFAQQAALAFLEEDRLHRFATTFAFDDGGMVAGALAGLGSGAARNLLAQLRRRTIRDLPRDKLDTQPGWEIAHTLGGRIGGRLWADRLWDHMSRAYTRGVARRLDPVGAVYAYEYTALEAFERAGEMGVRRILDFPSLNSRQYEDLQREQKQRFPELVTPFDSYFERKFETRQARRDAEMRLADVIITNSSLTRRSHIEGGADPAKTFAVPYGAPADLADPAAFRNELHGPLRAVWAGTFSIRKGAHYLLEAWRELNAGPHARLDAYGAIGLPPRLMESLPDGVHFNGSVPQAALLEAFSKADVLVFPTLSDGFGMVVTEAFARGLPVVTTSQAGAADLVEHGRNGLIVPAGDPRALTETLRWCLDNRDRLNAMRFAALETARRWQWSDYRRALRNAVGSGLVRPIDSAPASSAEASN